jgi:tetratricopeptide (TPR) repeat protein
MRGQRAASNAAVVVAVLALVVAGGAVIFFVATPGGRQAFRSFLDWAAGKEPAAELDAETLMFLERAQQALEENKLDEAEVAANAVLTRAPDNSEAESILRQVESRRKQAEELRRKTVHDEAMAEARRFLAAAELDRAEGFAKKALAAIPESEQAKEFLDRIAVEKEQLAAELARRRKQADELTRQGFAALAAEEYAQALDLAKQALALHEENAAALILKSQAERELKRLQGKPTPSESDQEKRAAADGFFQIAKISWDAGDYAGTEKYAKKALDVWPEHEGAKYLLEKAIKARLAALEKEEPAGAAEAREVVAFLEKLDEAITRKDADGLDRLVSPGSRGGVITGVAANRAQEMQNARDFFEVASDIMIKRETKPKDVRATKDLAEAISQFRISFRIGEVAVSRQFRARYSLAREGGDWKLRSVTVEDEQP